MTPRERYHQRLNEICTSHRTRLSDVIGPRRFNKLVSVRRQLAETLVHEFGLNQAHAARILNRCPNSISRLLAPPERREARLQRLRDWHVHRRVSL